jgi:inosine/xanthosine triphosphate pyrophosphatase family protein
MRNIENYSLKKTIFMTFDEYKELIKNVTNGLKEPKYEYDGLYYEDTEEAIKQDKYFEENIVESLSKYFDTKITSVHADDSEYLGVWIVYQNN